jgi:hypothetical protein
MSTDKTPQSKPPILRTGFGLNAPKTERAGEGARNLAEIREALEQKAKIGDYHDSSKR